MKIIDRIALSPPLYWLGDVVYHAIGCERGIVVEVTFDSSWNYRVAWKPELTTWCRGLELSAEPQWQSQN